MENKLDIKIYAKINLNGKTELVLINDDLAKRERIIEELSMMTMEIDPVLNVPDEDKHIPIIMMPHLFEHSEYDDIRLVCDTKTQEFEELMTPIILNHFNIKLNSNQILVFLENYRMSKEDLANGIVMNHNVKIINNCE